MWTGDLAACPDRFRCLEVVAFFSYPRLFLVSSPFPGRVGVWYRPDSRLGILRPSIRWSLVSYYLMVLVLRRSVAASAETHRLARSLAPDHLTPAILA